METKEPTRLGDWQTQQDVDELLNAFGYSNMRLANEIIRIVNKAIKRHERTLRRHGLLMEQEKTELEKKEEETHA